MDSATLEQPSQDLKKPLPKFCDLPEKYMCVRCKNPLYRPSQTICGHKICSPCLGQLLDSSQPAMCPAGEEDCVEIISANIFADFCSKKEMQQLGVNCNNERFGCQETMAWKNLDAHAAQCEFAQEKCSNEGCAEWVLRRELEQHRGECRDSPLKCKYGTVGCPFQGSEDELGTHHRDARERHLDLLTGHNAAMEVAITQLQDEVKSLLQSDAEQKRLVKSLQDTQLLHDRRLGEVERDVLLCEQTSQSDDLHKAEVGLRFQCLESTSYGGVLVWKINDYRRRKRDAIDGKTLSLYSQPFYTGRHGYKMCARAYLNGDGLGKKTHVSLFFVVMRGDYDALLSWPFRERVEMTLLDALGGGKHYSDRFNPDARNESFKKPSQAMNKASGFPLFLAQSVVESSGEPYLAHDTIYIKVVVGRREIH